MRVGITGTHGTGKTTLAGALCARLPGHVMADEPYYLLEEAGYEFGFPPSLEDYRALLARSVQSLSSPPAGPPPYRSASVKYAGDLQTVWRSREDRSIAARAQVAALDMVRCPFMLAQAQLAGRPASSPE
jgi:hypothetical protein